MLQNLVFRKYCHPPLLKIVSLFFSPHSLHWQCAQQEISKCKFNNIQPFTRINSHQIHNGM